METLLNIKNNNTKLYDKLMENDCNVIKNSKIIYHGKLKEFNTDNYDNIIYEFNISNNIILLLHDENKYVKQLNNLFENKEFKDIFDDHKLFNQSLLIASKLPYYGKLDETLYDNTYYDKFTKYGKPLLKIYEWLIL